MLRRFPEHSLLRFCDGVKAALVSGARESLAVTKADAPEADKAAFLNPIITWRQTCTEPGALPSRLGSLRVRRAIAHRTLAKPAAEVRSVIYSQRQLEQAETHDQLWNAAPIETVTTGWMHNHVRMYWAKKILEWSRSAAMLIALPCPSTTSMNDKYELDGSDPTAMLGLPGQSWGSSTGQVRAAHARTDPLPVGREPGGRNSIARNTFARVSRLGYCSTRLQRA